MSTAEAQDKLLALALAVSDGRPVDWQGALDQSPELAGPLARLAALARVTAEADTDDAAPPLFTWGTLRVLRPLGRGSFGEVFAAWDPALQREVALKLRREEAGSAGSLAWLAEARNLARVRHPNVLTIFGADVHEGRAGMWTELLEGRTLEETLAAAGPLGAREAALIGLDLCAALAAVHGAGLVHGDVKPANVMRVGAATGDPAASGRIVLMDFGAAHDGGGTMLGTPLSAAPELLAGAKATPRSDLYALGVLLYRLVSGRYPVEAKSAEELRARHGAGQRTRLRDARPDLPRAFVDAVERALDPDPARRFGGAAEMEQALSAVVGPSAPVAPAPAARSRRRAAVVTAAAVLVVVAALAWKLGPGRGTGTLTGPAPGPGATATAPATAPGATTAPGPAAAPAPGVSATAPDVDAALFLVGDGTRQRLRDGDPIAPGDQIALEITVAPASYAYVLDEDAAGNVTLLFPLPGGAIANPLAAGTRHHLPGADAKGALNWQVTSSGGEDRFLIAAATAPVPELEAALRSVSPAREGAAVRYPSLSPDGVRRLRGVGGVAHAPGPAPARSALADLAARLGAPGRAIWLRLVTLENP